MNNRIAVFAGSFDPPTLGHLDIIRRSAVLYDQLHVVVAGNVNKKNFFSPQMRCDLLREMVSDISNVTVHTCDGLVVEFAKSLDAGVMIRGVRALTDFSFEFELAQTNRLIVPEIETLFMPTDPKYLLIRSSAIREMFHYGADISKMVPPVVLRAMEMTKNS